MIHKIIIHMIVHIIAVEIKIEYGTNSMFNPIK